MCRRCRVMSYDFIASLRARGGILYLVTHNVRDVRGAAQFGVEVLRPAEFLELVRKAV